MNVRFGVFADLHIDFIHDSRKRFDGFLSECRESEVDFCVQLGDFCPPNGVNTADKEYIIEQIKTSTIPFYHVLGNHDMDANCKIDVLKYIGASDAHNSFDYGGVHFVILDACYYQTGSEYINYNYGNYRELSGDVKIPVLPPSELAWLQSDLEQAKYPTIIFTHQSLIESRAGIQNTDEFRKVVASASNDVIFAVCGHEHVDRLEHKDGIWYLCLNSMSYYWAGSKYTHDTYPQEIVEKYDKLTKVFPYKGPLYAIVEVNDEGISVYGKQTSIVGATPKELQFEKKGLVDEITASIKDRYIRFK